MPLKRRRRVVWVGYLTVDVDEQAPVPWARRMPLKRRRRVVWVGGVAVGG